jgi:Holliday junction resolvase RusA-like endonuclease
MGVTPEQFREMELRSEANRHKGLAVRSSPAHISTLVTEWPWPLLPLAKYVTTEFVFQGKPIGKPRQTHRDQWQKRPCVLRYRAFADAIRAAAGNLPPEPDIVLVTAYIPMPPSWSKKKKDALAGQPCRQKPDWDNIGKACCDALFDEDACIWLGLTAKYWCREGQERLSVKVLYAKS